jgi:hypothetical protein
MWDIIEVNRHPARKRRMFNSQAENFFVTNPYWDPLKPIREADAATHHGMPVSRTPFGYRVVVVDAATARD